MLGECMKKVCILCAANIKHMTLVSLYTEVLKKYNVLYDLIYIDKYNEEEASEAKIIYRFQIHLKKGWSFSRKLLEYWKFRKFAINIIENNKYDFIIVWNEFSAFMFSDYLAKEYKGKYCINIRDYNYNSVFFVQKRLKKAVYNSAFSTISSERFLDFLPRYNYIFIHSYNDKLLQGIKQRKKMREKNNPIRLMFIGRLSYIESKIKTINALGNDNRFLLYFYGTGCNDLLDNVKDKKYNNIIIKDEFEPIDTADLLSDADVIFSLNKEKELFSDVLLPIKLYYAICMHIPILAFKSSYTYEYARKLNIAIGVEEKDFTNLGDIIYDQYYKMDQQSIDCGCESAFNDIKKSHSELNSKILDNIIT